jgi:glycosyltransferase involved in cell wall biosynthesis
MKIGLFIGDIRPTDGGGFIYVSELLREFGRVEGVSKHEFVLFHHGNPEIATIAGKLPRIDLRAEKPTVLSGKERFFENFPGVVGRSWDRAFRVSPNLSWDARVFRKHGVEFVLRLVPWHAMTMDIPFGAVIWDLQHRNNPWFPEISERGEWEGRERNFSLLCQRASLMFTGTRRGLQEIETYYRVPRERIRVAPFPVPRFALEHQQARANPDLLSKFNLPKGYLFYPAQFWPHKNHVVVLEACRLIRAKGDWDLGVVFVGSDKGNQHYIEEHARRTGLEASTRFLDYVSQEELVQLYKQAFCLVFPTFCGPDNLPPLEAFALSCPVIASSVPGAEEQLGDAALLFPAQDEHKLTEHILQLQCNSQLRQNLIEKGLKQASLHTWSDYARVMVDAFDEFANIRRAWGA